ncbi:hypothetical protein BP6252_04914 [Coleophoma cylindrospora]|uniref:Cytochrome P450 n=1 Tax=Coleophoma cylindrospora TaxID=1849047 RepID=A0A3D8S1Z0_9HELO|nr:hypothetical protein BP6252_04914 [Coleophoma cylindrospora]
MLKTVILEGLAAFGAARLLPHYTSFSPYQIFFLAFALQLVGHFVYAVLIYPYWISPLRNIPGPPGGTLLYGHGVEEIGKSAGIIQHLWLKNIKNPDPNFFRYLGFFGQEKLVPISAEASRLVLTDPTFELPGWFREGAKTLLGDGLVLAEGDAHKYLRKRVAPAFTPAQIRHFIPDFWNKCTIMNQMITDIIKSDKDDSKDTTTINMLDWTNRVTFDMIGKTAFGAEFEGLPNPDKGFYDVFNRNYPPDGFTHPLDAICMNVLPIFVPHGILNYLPLPRYQAQLRDREVIRSRCIELIRNIDVSKIDKSEGVNQQDLLTVMVSGGEIEEDVMIENMMTFIAAGFGTNAASLVWALHALATHPEIQTRLRKEIREKLKTPDTPLTSSLMDSMKYLHCVVMENTRLYPSIPGSWRQAMKSTTVLGLQIPKDTQFVMSSYLANRSEKNWGPDSEEFNPDRWAEATMKKGVEHNGQFLTYSVGHKSCIGKEYSLRAMKSVIIALIGTFEFTFEGKKKFEMEDLVAGLTMRPRGGLKCEVKLASPWV